jgi:hypothetical protein
MKIVSYNGTAMVFTLNLLEAMELLGYREKTYLPAPSATASSEPGPPHDGGFTITLRHTTLGRTPLDE